MIKVILKNNSNFLTVIIMFTIIACGSNEENSKNLISSEQEDKKWSIYLVLWKNKS